MTQTEFTIKLLALVFCGLLYVFTFMSMAKRNSQETLPLKHPVLKVVGILFALLGVIYAIMSIIFITQSPYSVFYSTIPYQYQSRIFVGVLSCFIFFGLSAYCFLFKRSDSKWWIKVRKVLFGIGLTLLYFAINISFEINLSVMMFILCIFVFISFITISNAREEAPIIPEQNDKKNQVVEEQSNKQILQKEDTNSSQTKNENDLIIVADTKDESGNVFCRFCGEAIDSTEIYCKHCGKKL